MTKRQLSAAGITRNTLSRETERASRNLLQRALDMGIEFKLRSQIYGARLPADQIRDLLVSDLPDGPTLPDQLLDELSTTVIPLCKNEADPQFLGFSDTGDDIGALVGGVLGLFTQQNLINQDFDAPSATFIEMAVLRWLRGLIGYPNPSVRAMTNAWDAGGVITHGGTMSNAVAMMLAREHAVPGTMERGVTHPDRYGIIVPRGIGHYSVKSALTWIGVGGQVIEVDTFGYRYEPAALDKALREYSGRIMSVVCYAGDSRTQTVDNLRQVAETVRSVDAGIWLHADACWGLTAAFSSRLRHLIDGIELYDSVTVDPHKVMAMPYALSALLVRRPDTLRSVASYSDLIMREDFAFGQVTPFVGSKPWLSLRLWMMMRSYGCDGLALLADQRVARTRQFTELVDAHPRLLRIHKPDLTAVAFLYLPSDHDPYRPNVARINDINQRIHSQMLREGVWHLHQFSIADDAGAVQRDAVLYPQRFMGGNSRIESRHLHGVIDYVANLGDRLAAGEEGSR